MEDKIDMLKQLIEELIKLRETKDFDINFDINFKPTETIIKKSFDEFLKERFTEDEIKEIKRRKKAKETSMKKYTVLFYTPEDLSKQTCSYEMEASQHDIIRIGDSLDNYKNHNYIGLDIGLDGVFIDLSKFAVIEYDEIEEEDEEE